MQDTIQTAALALPPLTAVLMGALSLFFSLFIGLAADLAARRLGFGPLLGLTVLAASVWIVVLAFGAAGLSPGVRANAFGATLAVVGLSAAFLAAVFYIEGRTVPREE